VRVGVRGKGGKAGKKKTQKNQSQQLSPPEGHDAKEIPRETRTETSGRKYREERSVVKTCCGEASG